MSEGEWGSVWENVSWKADEKTDEPSQALRMYNIQVCLRARFQVYLYFLTHSSFVHTSVCPSACARARKRIIRSPSLSEGKSRENRKYSSRRAKLRSRRLRCQPPVARHLQQPRGGQLTCACAARSSPRRSAPTGGRRHRLCGPPTPAAGCGQ